MITKKKWGGQNEETKALLGLQPCTHRFFKKLMVLFVFKA